MSIFYDNFQNRFLANAIGTIDNVSDWVGIGGNGYVAFTNILFGSTSIGKALQLGRAVEGVAISFAVGGSSPNWAGVINAAAGLAVAAVVIYAFPLTVPVTAAGLVVSYIAGIFAQSVYEAILDTYPNLASDIAGFGDDLVTAIEDAVTDLFDNLRDILDNMDFPNPSDWLFDPLVVDLNGDGIEITELSRSNVFMDSGGDGLLHRTAWAGTGDGVLFVDVNGDNRIGEQREYVFTEWDPTAASDLAALRSVFDTNGDGKLTAADQGFAQFKVMVTNADGSQTARTLAELGITEISLIGDATHITLPDGTVISEAYEADDDACTRTADPHLRLAA